MRIFVCTSCGKFYFHTGWQAPGPCACGGELRWLRQKECDACETACGGPFKLGICKAVIDELEVKTPETVNALAPHQAEGCRMGSSITVDSLRPLTKPLESRVALVTGAST